MANNEDINKTAIAVEVIKTNCENQTKHINEKLDTISANVRELISKIDKKIDDHEKRITTIEASKKSIIAISTSIISALGTVIIYLIKYK